MVAITAIQDLRDPGVTVGDKGSPTSLAFNHIPDVTLPRGMQLKFASYLSEGCIVHNLQTSSTFFPFKFISRFECCLCPIRQHMRQCQIRVQFESVGLQFFKVLKKWFRMTKYIPIIVLWCSERGFYKKVTWSPVSGVLPMPQITWQRTWLY